MLSPDTPVTLTLPLSSIDDLRRVDTLTAERDRLKSELSGMTDQLMSANATIATLNNTLAANESVYRQALDRINALLKTNREQAARIAELEALDSTPVIVRDPDPVITPTAANPVISKTELRHIAGMCITLGLKAPSAAVDAAARDLMHIGKRMGFNTVRFFRNKDEVAQDVGRSPDDLRNLYAYALSLGLMPVADTVDIYALRGTDTELSAYLQGLKRLGAALLIFNDANQYRSAKYEAGTLERMVKRVRDLSDLPLLASVTAGAKVDEYKPLFDFVEAQTFGTVPELDRFLSLPFDVFCLDGQSDASLDYLRKAHDVIVKHSPAAWFYYTALDLKTDWRVMPDKTALIEKTVKALVEQWRVPA